MDAAEREQRRRKVEAGRAKLAHFRQRKTKGDCANSEKKTAKRKGSAVDAPVQEESPVATEDGARLGGGAVCKSTACIDSPDAERGAFAAQATSFGFLPQEREQECEPEIAELVGRPDGQQQTQTVHSLELEALRLSLSNMHTVQLELTQANLQKEKETALTELREMLNSRRAQELALLQSRQQHELELLREQHAREKEEMALRCSQETAELKEKLQSEMEKNVQIMETVKQDWESERDLCLEELRKELSAKHQLEMEDLRSQFQEELAEQKAELEKIFQAKNQAESTLENLEAQHEAAIKKLREDLQSEHCRYLEDLELKFKEKEREKQLELETLQASYEDLRAQSQQEIRHLWSQLESTGTNRQELNELREQLLARTSHVEELEYLKRDFEQQRQQEKTQHESELEQLRIYFEEKLRYAEKTYQEDLTLLQHRLQEVKEDSLLESVETSSPCACLEETPEKEKTGCLDQLDLQPEQHEGSPPFQADVGGNRGRQSEAPTSPVHSQHEGHVADRRRSETEALGREHLELGRLPAALSQHSQELALVRPLRAHGAALEVDTEVAARVLNLETEHKVKLSLLQTELREEIELLKMENRNLREKLQHEIRLKDDLEQVKHNLVEVHQEELNKTKEKNQLLKQELKEKEAEWKVLSEDLKREAEEKLTLMLLELREKAESEKRSALNTFELREEEMRQLQDQQAAQILALEQSLAEQQGRLQQLEQGLAAEEAPPGSQCGDREQALRVQEDCALQLMLARNRFLEERKAITEKFNAEQDAVLREAQEKHGRELQLLQERHQQQLQDVSRELEDRHQAELHALAASLESEWRAQLDARVAELQAKHVAEIHALEARHRSSLDAVESCCLAEVQTVRGEHRRALERLQADFAEQLQRKDAAPQAVLSQESEELKLKHDKELRSAQDGPRAAASAGPVTSLEAPAPELPGACQGEFESEKKAALHAKQELCRLGSQQAQALCQKEKESLSLQLREKDDQIQQLEEQVLSLSHKVEESRSELEMLQQRRERENQEGENLISMLRADVDLSHSERRALQDALRRLLALFGETLQAAVALRSQIGDRVGLCLEDAGAAGADQVLPAAPTLDEMWSDAAPLEVDRTVSECAEMSCAAEVSSHVRESFLMSPDSALGCEQTVRRVYQSLGLAVDGLLEMVLDSTRQLEEARQIHSRFEKEFSCKNEETAQVVRKHKELLARLEEQSVAKAGLELQLHTAQGILEGLKVEKTDLQEALGRKEEAERHLVLELEGLRRQLGQAAREQAALREEYGRLWSQKEASAAEAEEREAALRKEVECLTKEQSETRKQSEKDRSALLSQMKLLECELEEQLSQHQGCARQAEEVTALKQQMASLDKHLRNQRHFMDEQAAEREHEREEFQQEIQRLEGQLRQAARPQPQGPVHSPQRARLDEEVELLQQKLREKSDAFNELVVKKELADRQVLIQEEEIKHLEEMNANTRRQVVQLQEELEKQKKAVKELQDGGALQEQQMTHLLLESTLQSERGEGSCPGPPADGPPAGPEVPWGAAQRAPLQRDSKVLDLKGHLEETKDDLVNTNEEVRHLNLKSDVQNTPTAMSIRELEEENANLKVVCARSSEIEELKATIENLQENQERLHKDKAEEIERLHEVIEKLQQELSLTAPAVQGASGSRVGSLQSELLCSQVEGPCGQALQGELQAALAAKEALSQLLADQAHRHSQGLQALQQRLQGAEEAAARQLAELGRSAALREAEVEGMAARVREFEAALKAKEATIAERDLEIDAVNRWKAAHSSALKAVLSAVARFRGALEQQPLAGPAEPPELQRLRAQCVRLSRQLQVLNQRSLRCQMELDRQQAHGACRHPGLEGGTEPWVLRDSAAPEQVVSSRRLTSGLLGQDQDPRGDLPPAKVLVMLKDPGLHTQDSATPVLTVCQRQLRSELLLLKNEMRSSLEGGGAARGSAKAKEKGLEDCQLQKVDLIAQVKQLQEKLNHLVYSVTFQDVNTADFKFQQPLASAFGSENSSSDGSHNGEESDKSPPVDAFAIDRTMRDLTDATKDQDYLIRNEMPDFPIQEKSELQDGSHSLPARVHGGALSRSDLAEPLKSPVRVLDLSSWSSPEVLRKDSALEPQPSLPLTPHSDVLSLRSADASLQDGTQASLLLAAEPGLLGSPGVSAAGQAPPWAESPPADHLPVERMPVEKDVEDFIITSFDSQETLRSPPPGLEENNDGSEESDGSGFRGKLSPRSGGPEAPAGGPVSRRSRQPPAAMKGKDVQAQHVKALLQMVCEESRQILALSEGRGPPSALGRGEPCAPLDPIPREGQGLLEAAPQKGEKEPPDVRLGWRGEFLQAVQAAFDKEWRTLKLPLQPGLGSSDPGCDCLLERLEKVIQAQEDLQETSLEHLRVPDRSSLLSEVQALRAQLRLTHLQNQEKLQQLCAALTSVEARGSWQEHQLRRQVELLAYKVEQEKCIASDLQKTLSEEQEKAGGVRKLLAAEQSAVKALKSELCECRQENERLLKSLDDVQQEVLQLRSLLDGKESDLQAALQELECERGKERVLQSRLEEQQLQHLQREGQSSKSLEVTGQRGQSSRSLEVTGQRGQSSKSLEVTGQRGQSSRSLEVTGQRGQSSKSLEELRTSLEKQRAQSSRLGVALRHEQTARDNLQKELRIEHSRFEALLAQERARLCQLQKDLEAEKSHSLELSEALQHERLLTEQLSRRTQEVCAQQDAQAQQALLRKLQEEKSRVLELQAVLDAAQQQAVRAQQQLEAEAQRRCEELRREKEVSAAWTATVEALQTQKRERRRCLEREGEQPAWLQADLAQSRSRSKEPEGPEDTRSAAETRQSRARAGQWRKWQREKEKLRELELQRQREEHKIRQLQRTVRELESQEEALRSGLPRGAPRGARGSDGPDQLREQEQELEKIRHQLLCAAGLLTSFVRQAVGRTVSDWASSNENAVASLLRTLEELKPELSRPTPCQKKMSAELQIQLVEVLLQDNDSLTKALSVAAEEKSELSRAVSKLEKTLKHHVQKGCALSRSDRPAWRQDGTVPRSSQHSDPGRPPPAASAEANTCNVRMEKLYLHYLRAESFRKALIYQKKYLLLLIGGFQDSEQETLSMIAHLGVFPSKADKKITTSRPFTKFRTAVRVVIAILRLRFLVKKWQEVDRKGALAPGKAPRPGPRASRRQQSPESRESPPTRDVSSGHTRDPARGPGAAAAASPSGRGRSTPSPNSRLERSLTASEDPEHSLTEYIHHLETIQQRLGGLPPDFTSKKSCHQKSKQ
ncbi:pericentrin [Eulemur rufifrons]|uniref:pericentrin n=1 Tax=Eulemur rufifrons TaxID=859984 RepID=UPI00374403CB